MFKFLVLSLLGLNIYAIENIANQQFVDNSYFSKQSLMGDWSSGGGNVVVCFKDSARAEAFEILEHTEGGYLSNEIFEKDMIASIELYDLFEAKLPRGIQATRPEILEISKKEEFNEYLTRVLNRMWSAVPSISYAFADGSQLIKDSDIRFYNGGLKQQNDIGEATFIDQSSCVIQTMAIQRNLGDAFELFIDARLFNHSKHSRQSKVSLLIHEYIYAYSRRELGHKLSLPTRKLVGTLISYHDSLTINNVSSMAYHLGYTSLSRNDELENDKDFEAALIVHSLGYFVETIQEFDYKMLFTLEEHTRKTNGKDEYHELINYLINAGVLTKFENLRSDQLHVIINDIPEDFKKQNALNLFELFNTKKKEVLTDFWDRKLEALKTILWQNELFSEEHKEVLFDFYSYEVAQLITWSIDWISYGESKNPYGSGLDTSAQLLAAHPTEFITVLYKKILSEKIFKNTYDPFDIIIPK